MEMGWARPARETGGQLEQSRSQQQSVGRIDATRPLMVTGGLRKGRAYWLRFASRGEMMPHDSPAPPADTVAMVDHACPACRAAQTWVTFRSHSSASLICPTCQHSWSEDRLHEYPALLSVPPTKPRTIV